MQIKYSTKLGEKEVRALRRLSRESRVPQSKLLEEAIHLLEAQLSTDVISPDFRRLVDQTIKEDLPALRRLAE